MSASPTFVGSYRQAIATLKPGCPKPHFLFRPQDKGTDLLSLTLSNEKEKDMLLEFIVFSKGVKRKINLSKETTPNLWKARPEPDYYFFNDVYHDGQEVLLSLTDLMRRKNAEKLYDMAFDAKIEKFNYNEILLKFKDDFALKVGVETFYFYPWIPFLRVKVPRRAGYDGNPSVSALDPQKKEPLFFDQPLFARLIDPDTTLGILTLTLILGDY